MTGVERDRKEDRKGARGGYRAAIVGHGEKTAAVTGSVVGHRSLEGYLWGRMSKEAWKDSQIHTGTAEYPDG
jgi:hypothetical protein